MFDSINKFAQLLWFMATLASAFATLVMAQDVEQTDKESAVTILKKLDAKARFGNRESNLVMDEKSFNEILASKENAFLKQLEMDFSTQTLIVVTVQGDCFVRATVDIKRDDEAKKYLCRVTKIYGGCRAAGTFQSWVVIEKVRPGYTLEFVEMKPIDGWRRTD